ncbi:hypothetical protein WQ54_21180 [Bacillus sp. SA1-12]|uniref:bifunctional ADP-dependent NAD(P)H-hydrate dehydratase/NAD(P)H-hydrate epimerase n=1 Tax=Bacillus sp. SA1-12 TaxID=1455638 RepID=UPI0006273211|nr:bifunctional ADP-dependent NAD(P)H-hydrate dehydratase/NAD(P)H-hydrate epimerase [Bacillus sp. SA1-12]KKI90467.1 hypothetical protein WQ54_21180 [Bacillus sp. SA1-12]
MFAAGQKEMQQLDQYTIETIGLPGAVLMENAGAKVLEEIMAVAPSKRSKVSILCGGGNNGGDGIVIARKLFDLGIEPSLFLLVKPEKLKGDAKIHFQVYKNRGLPYSEWHEKERELLESTLKESDIIVDALLGTGAKGEIREPFRTVIEMVNQKKKEQTVISVDIPSGVNSDDGKAEGLAIKADKTVTFVYPKKGFFLQEGPLHVGEWKAVDISVPPSIVDELKLQLPRVITDELVKNTLPKRVPNGHKGTFGHVLVIGGSRQYVGAPIFTAKAVLNSGAGLVTLGIPEIIYPMAAAQNPESLFLPLPDKEGHLSEESIHELTSRLGQFDCVAVGPGMSRFAGGEGWLKSLLSALTGQPVVIDADALYFLRNELDVLRHYKGPVVLTPHPGEMATLSKKTVKEIEESRLETALDFAREYKVFLLLKGHRTIIASPSGEVFINPHGHDALGKGGSGDILTGLIASFLAQGAKPENALISASFLHAKGGEEKGKQLSNFGVMPLDIIESMKELLRNYQSDDLR